MVKALDKGMKERMAVVTPEKIRILTVDDHPVLREGLAAMIQSQAAGG